jgi:hypothetical protein
VHASLSRPGTDTGMHAGGTLQRYTEAMALRAPSQAAAYTVGEALIVLPKDDFTGAEFSDTPPAWAEARFGGVKLSVVEG